MTTQMAEAPESGEVDPVKIAVVWVEKAQSGSVQWTNECSAEQIRAYRIRKKLKPLTIAVRYSLLLLGFFEVPCHCMLDLSKCPASALPGWSHFVLPLSVTNSAAIVLWLYLAASLWLRWKALGRAHVFTWWHTVGGLVVAVALADCIAGAFNVGGLLWFTSFRLSRGLRPVAFMCYSRTVRTAAARIVRSIPRFMDVIAVLAICIAFYTWAGLIIFAESEEGRQHFGTWSRSFTNLYILFTTANCPDVFLVAYEKNRLNFLFFFSFLLLTVYILSNVLLARVYDAYKEELKSMVKLHFKNQRQAMKQAYELLGNEHGNIGLDSWTKFFTYLCDPSLSGGGLEYSDNQAYNKVRANQVFQALDKDHNGGLDLEEFKLVLDVLHHSEVYIPRRRPPPGHSLLKDLFTEGIYFRGKRLISWDALVDFVILVDVVLVFSQTVLFINGGSGYDTRPLDPGHPWYWALLGFSIFYVLTVSLKIGVLGFERFWYVHPVQNRFDFFNVYGCFAAEVACLCMKYGAPADWLRLVLLLHMTRSLRVLHYIRALKHIANFMVRLAPTYYRMGMLLLLVFYVYGQIGQQLFGGLVYRTNPVLVGSDFAASDYWNMNFNDFSSSMVTLFVLMVLNNWFVITDAFIRVTGTRWAAAFFVSFFFIVNMVVLNILIALIIDVSGTLREEMEHEEEEEEDEEDQVPHGDSHLEYNFEDVLRRVLLDEKDLDSTKESTKLAPAGGLLQRYGSFGPSSGQMSRIGNRKRSVYF